MGPWAERLCAVEPVEVVQLLQACADAPDVGQAGDAPGGLTSAAQSGQDDADEQGDDGYHHQQFDQCEGATDRRLMRPSSAQTRNAGQATLGESFT